jgi:hypothetical protein
MVRAILRLGHLMPGKPMGRNRAMSIGFAMTANGVKMRRTHREQIWSATLH